MLALRGAAHVVPRATPPCSGPGALAADEDSLREQLAGAWPGDRGGRVDRPRGAGRGHRRAGRGAGRRRAPHQGPARARPCTGGSPSELEPWCDVCDVHHVPDQLLRLAGTAGVFAYGWPHGSRQMLMATDIWLGEPLGGDVGREPRSSSPAASCTPTGPVVAPPLRRVDGHRRGRGPRPLPRPRAASWSTCGSTVRRSWSWPPTVEALATRRWRRGRRLLPAGDPFLAQRDRATLVPDRARQRAVWRPVGSPGLVLMTGHPVGTWRARRRGAACAVTVDAVRRRWATASARRSSRRRRGGAVPRVRRGRGRVRRLMHRQRRRAVTPPHGRMQP